MSKRDVPALAALFLLAWCMLLTHQAAEAWRSNVMLWTQAVAVAPSKPRPAQNLGVSLMLDGQVSLGVRYLLLADRLAQLPHVPQIDKLETEDKARGNIRALLAGVMR